MRSGNWARTESTLQGALRTLAGLALALAASVAGSLPAAASPTYFADPICYDNYSGAYISCNIHMRDFGGPTMTGTTFVYNIWYGNWGADSSISTLAGLFSDLTGTEYMNIGALYGVSTNIVFRGTTLVSDYLGDYLDESDLSQIVTDFGRAAPNAIYMIYTAPNVREQSDGYACAFHSDVNGLKYAWVSGFNAQPNRGCGDAETDSITSSASHEFFETLTDPLVNEARYFSPPLGWYDGGPGHQGEIADPCNDSSFRANLNGRFYEVQSIFVNDASYAAGGYCASGNTFPRASAVPEPATWTMMIGGAGFVGAALRRRRPRFAR